MREALGWKVRGIQLVIDVTPLLMPLSGARGYKDKSYSRKFSQEKESATETNY